MDNGLIWVLIAVIGYPFIVSLTKALVSGSLSKVLGTKYEVIFKDLDGKIRQVTLSTNDTTQVTDLLSQLDSISKANTKGGINVPKG
ncbi:MULTISPECIES: hypothetical protein [Shewanella]|uniref:hypothetical protein n=1 Tax=Shewanella TaxID=22 RepID=UPI00015881CF|nr:hypothetical protein [Shewanella baltica]ABS08017.1 hypothetical protein Shew185_1874 [Shewanella baltica OS185]